MASKSYRFTFSLDVLNQLGRGLYKNFAVAIAEAVSNAWDANAENVYIKIDRKNKTLTILDDGDGMSPKDFKEKFLNIGYSRRRDDTSINTRRRVHGRKGIGKLALLSVADRIEIRTRKSAQAKITGGVIDNKVLDEAIDAKEKKYHLEALNDVAKRDESIPTKGTKLIFNGVQPRFNSAKIIRRYLSKAYSFPIASSEDTFNIYVNGKIVSIEDFRSVFDNTEVVWFFDDEEDRSRWDRYFPSDNKAERHTIKSNYFRSGRKKQAISGYIASVDKPSHLKAIPGADDSVMTINLYTNGRIRQENIFGVLKSARLVPEYLYGEIHIDSFDDGTDKCKDIFSTDRDAIMEQSAEYHSFIRCLRKVQTQVFSEWDAWRRAKKAKLAKDIPSTGPGSLKPKFRKLRSAWTNALEEDELEKAKKLVDGLLGINSKGRERKILITHSSVDKEYADLIFDLLLNLGFNAKELIYSSAPASHPEKKHARLPIKDMFEYLRKFFVQNTFENPIILIVHSEETKKWYPTLEIGATWVLRKDHKIIRAGKKASIDSPLSTQDAYLVLRKSRQGKLEFTSEDSAIEIFQKICTECGKEFTIGKWSQAYSYSKASS